MSHGFSVGRNNAEQLQRARSAQGAAQFAAGPALHANSGPASEDALVP